jgi:hypothetical protein
LFLGGSSIKTFDFSTLHTTLPLDKLKTCLKETIHKAFSHRNYGSKFVVLGYKSTYFSNKIHKGKTCYSASYLLQAFEETPTHMSIKINLLEEGYNSYPMVYLEFDDRDQLSTKIYDKRDDFNFKFINFPNMCSNIPASPANGVYISQLVPQFDFK